MMIFQFLCLKNIKLFTQPFLFIKLFKRHNFCEYLINKFHYDKTPVKFLLLLLDPQFSASKGFMVSFQTVQHFNFMVLFKTPELLNLTALRFNCVNHIKFPGNSVLESVNFFPILYLFRIAISERICVNLVSTNRTFFLNSSGRL